MEEHRSGCEQNRIETIPRTETERKEGRKVFRSARVRHYARPSTHAQKVRGSNEDDSVGGFIPRTRTRPRWATPQSRAPGVGWARTSRSIPACAGFPRPWACCVGCQSNGANRAVIKSGAKEERSLKAGRHQRTTVSEQSRAQQSRAESSRAEHQVSQLGRKLAGQARKNPSPRVPLPARWIGS